MIIPKQILIIDDEEMIQTVVNFGLRMASGWKVLTASSGIEGIYFAHMEKPDAILLDIMMPDMDGIDTLKELQSHPRTEEIPVIFLTAKVQAAEKGLFNQLRVNGIITKPFNSLDLPQKIISLLDW